MTKFLMFTKESMVLVDLSRSILLLLKDSREDIIEEIYLDDFSNVPIPEENLNAKKYGVTTPVLLVIKDDDEDCVLEELVGGLNITQNIRRLWDKYYE